MIGKVYLIDDDEICVYVNTLLLEIEKFAEQIQSFASADLAYEALMQEADSSLPDLILLDLNMPIKSGWDFLDMLHDHEQRLLGRTHIFVLTSSLDDSERKNSERYALVAGFLHKPLDQDSITRIRNLLKSTQP